MKFFRFLLFLLIFSPTVSATFLNFETPTVHPLALSPSRKILAVCNLADGRVELFFTTNGMLTAAASIPVGVDPVTVRFRTEEELWVVNSISSSISVVDLSQRKVVRIIPTSTRPADVVFAGSPERAYVSASLFNLIQVFDPLDFSLLQEIPIKGQRPAAMTVSNDRNSVYVALRESGNGSTILSRKLTFLDTRSAPGPVDDPAGPYGGKNPPPNSGDSFEPAIGAALAAIPPPPVSHIVRKSEDGRWLDGNNRDWTEYVRGSKAPLSGRIQGWDLLDHDIAVIQTVSNSVSYIERLMTMCFDLAVNPSDGRIALVGTEALNQIRFEPNLKAIFTRINLALVNPERGTNAIKDLNPHLDYSKRTIPISERKASIGDPRAVAWSQDGDRIYVVGMGSDNLIVINDQGQRLGNPLPLPAGPSGLVLDATNNVLYVLSRFDAAVSVIDLDTMSVRQTFPLFDPTPVAIKRGRKHLYNTHTGSGLGQASCASCHPDARFDRLAWDLGNPLGENIRGDLFRNHFDHLEIIYPHLHPLKGPMVTQTLQDIIGHEPFHWQADRGGLKDFAVTFKDLQGADEELSDQEVTEFKDFLATIQFPPNPFGRTNSAFSPLPLTNFFATGKGKLAAGTKLPDGHAFPLRGNCGICHTSPGGLGLENTPLLDTNGNHQLMLSSNGRSDGRIFKIPHFRLLPEKLGLFYDRTDSTAGFGFLHDGRVDTLEKFVQDGFPASTDDQLIADVIAFLLLMPELTIPRAPFAFGRQADFSVGKQLDLATDTGRALVNHYLNTNLVDLIVREEGTGHAWNFDFKTRRYQSNRKRTNLSTDDLLSRTSGSNTFRATVVGKGIGLRLALDRDADGIFDGDEEDLGSNPADPNSVPEVSLNIRSMIGDQIELDLLVIPGYGHRLEQTTDLGSPFSATAAGSFVALDRKLTKTEPRPASNAAYYRLSLLKD